MAKPTKQVRHRGARQRRGPRATVYTDRVELLAAALELAKATIVKARGFPPADAELAMNRDYPMSVANFERTKSMEKDARAALAKIRQGHTLLRQGIDEAIALGRWRPSEEGRTLDGTPILISTRPPKAARPCGYAAAMTAPWSEKTFAEVRRALVSLDDWLANLNRRETALRTDPRKVRIDHRNLILHDFDHPWRGSADTTPARRWRPVELAAWSLLARGSLPGLLDVRGGLTAAEVLRAERLALRGRVKRRRPDPVNGSTWAPRIPVK